MSVLWVISKSQMYNIFKPCVNRMTLYIHWRVNGTSKNMSTKEFPSGDKWNRAGYTTTSEIIINLRYSVEAKWCGNVTLHSKQAKQGCETIIEYSIMELHVCSLFHMCHIWFSNYWWIVSIQLEVRRQTASNTLDYWHLCYRIIAFTLASEAKHAVISTHGWRRLWETAVTLNVESAALDSVHYYRTMAHDFILFFILTLQQLV